MTDNSQEKPLEDEEDNLNKCMDNNDWVQEIKDENSDKKVS